MHPELFEIGNISVSSWSVCVIVGVLLLVYFYIRDLRKWGVSEKNIDRIVLIGVIAGIFVYLGASFFDTLWHAIDIAAETGHFSLFDASGSLVGGVTFEGGIVGGFIVWFILFPLGMKKDKKHSLLYMDKLVTYIFLAHAIGRIGCFLAGCCYGKSTTSILGMMYPTDYGTLRVYPTQLFESFGLAVFFVIFKIFVKKNQTEKYLITYGIFRFFLEYLRGDSRGMVFGGIISPSQFLSIVFILGGIVCIIIRHKLYYKEHKELDELKEAYPELVDTVEFKKQLDDAANKYTINKARAKQAKKDNTEYVPFEEEIVINLENEKITEAVIREYMEIGQLTDKKSYLKTYISLGEIIILSFLFVSAIYDTTENIGNNKILKVTNDQAISYVTRYVVENGLDDPDIYRYKYIYTKDVDQKEEENKVYYHFFVHTSNSALVKNIYFYYDLETKTIVEVGETDYETVEDYLTVSSMHLQTGTTYID